MNVSDVQRHKQMKRARVLTPLSPCVCVCVSLCSLHSVFPHHLLRGAAATSQHVRDVSLWAAGHPCVRGQWWATQKRRSRGDFDLYGPRQHTLPYMPDTFWCVTSFAWGQSADLHSARPSECRVEQFHRWPPPLCSVFSAASTSLLSALYSVLRSIITVALLYGFCYGALKVRDTQT